MTTLTKPKFPRAIALKVAKELCDALAPACEPGRLKVCGSLRRGNPQVGDVEIVYVPKTETVKDGLFDSKTVSAADETLGELMHAGIIEYRRNARGSITWGDKNKLAVHCDSGIPVDLFSATLENWWNYVVCRTGNAESNIRICKAAQDMGWKWNPYGAGFTDDQGQIVPVKSEWAVFELVGLPYLEPWERN